MSSTMTRFSDAVYHRQDSYDFGMTVFTRRELKILLLIDGNRTVSDIARHLAYDTYQLMPDFANLVKMGLIQTEGGIMSAGISDVIFSEAHTSTSEFTLTRLPLGAAA